MCGEIDNDQDENDINQDNIKWECCLSTFINNCGIRYWTNEYIA